MFAFTRTEQTRLTADKTESGIRAGRSGPSTLIATLIRFSILSAAGSCFGASRLGLAQATLSPQSIAVLHSVDDHYNHLASLRARYVERYDGIGMHRAESGTLLLKKPGRMAWHYDQPAGKVFVFDGRFAWFYTPGDVQAQKIPAKQMDDLRTPLRFLLGHTKLEKELGGIAVAQDGDGLRITGVPKGMEQRVNGLSLRVTKGGAITQMTLEEVDGAKTEFSFSEMKENVPAAEKDFTFTPPAGVTVISGMPSN